MQWQRYHLGISHLFVGSLGFQWLICSSCLVWICWVKLSPEFCPDKILVSYCSAGLVRHYLKSHGLFNVTSDSQPITVLGKYLVCCVWSLRFEPLPPSLFVQNLSLSWLWKCFFYYFSLLQPVSQYKESKNCLYKIIPCLLHWCFFSYSCPWGALVSQSSKKMPYCCSGSRRLRNRLSFSVTPADDFTTSLSTTSHSPRAYCPCQTGLNTPITTVSSPDPQPPPTQVTTLLSPYCFTQPFLEEGPPKLCSLTTPQQLQLHNLCLCCLQYTMLASDVMSSFSATSHPTVLPATSCCLSAQSFTTPQALPISQNTSRQPPALCLPFPVSQLPPKECLNSILPPSDSHLFTTSCLYQDSSLPAFTTHSQHLTHHLIMHSPSMCMSYRHHGCPDPCAKVNGVKREEQLSPFLAVSTSLQGTILQQEIPAALDLGLCIKSLLLVHLARETKGDEYDPSQIAAVCVSGYRNWQIWPK